MILDTSAVVAILLKEQGYESLLARLVEADAVAIGTPTLVELGIVLLAKLGRDPSPEILRFLREYDVECLGFEEHHWHEAVSAYRRFGRRRHPAGLNLGDALSYATARVAGSALLCTGDDFPQTDLELA